MGPYDPRFRGPGVRADHFRKIEPDLLGARAEWASASRGLGAGDLRKEATDHKLSRIGTPIARWNSDAH